MATSYDPSMPMPKEAMPLLNRKGRRTQIALARKAKHQNRLYSWRKHCDDIAEARRNGLEFRLNKVRKRTFERKGRCNNPRFAF